MKGQRRFAFLHARRRNDCSDLKSDFFHNHHTDLVEVEVLLLKMLNIISLNANTIEIQDQLCLKMLIN